MKHHRLIRKLLVTTLLCIAPFLTLTACSVEQTEEGSLPDVEVEGGNLPEYDVDAAEITVTPEERTITVPDVDIHPPGDDVEDDSEDLGEDDGTQP